MMKFSEVDRSFDSEETLPPNQLSLTPLWEYAIRAQSLPDSLDLDLFFQTIHERLHNPEWEVRQHSLRVLVDFIPLIPKEILDEKIEIVLNDLVTNLGHLGPAVRKGAVDSLRAYVNHTRKPNEILQNLVENGIAKCQENKIQTNVVLGIILSLPYLINNQLDSETNALIVHRLLDKIVKVIHQETVLRSLLRIREIIGYENFDYALSTHESYNSKTDFDLLCEIYDLHVYNNNNNNNNQENVTLKNFNNNVDNADIDKVILETEIQLDSGSSITMKIHEEGVDNNNRKSTFQVLPDDDDVDAELTYEHLRRTPRRVHFGGEIVKLRTPDSDSNVEEDATISIISESGNKPVIEIKYNNVEDGGDKKKVFRSLIPRLIKQTESAPNSPLHPTTNLHTSKLFKSSPNLSKRPRIKPTGKSRIPVRLNNSIKKESATKKLDIPIVAEQPKIRSPRISKENKIKVPPIVLVRRNSREDAFSPKPIHNEIQVLHNLTRTPSPSFRHKQKDIDEIETPRKDINKVEAIATSNNNHLAINQVGEDSRRVLSEVTNLDTWNSHEKQESSHFPSFHVYNSINDSFYDLPDSPIPTKDTGDCLTCSSSGSESDKKKFTGIDDKIISDIQNMDDNRIRQRGLEELLRVIQSRSVLDSLQDRLPSLLHILFAAEQQPILQPIAEQTLSILFMSMNVQCLITRLHQISQNLSKMGTPLGVRLAILLMRRISPGLVVDQLLAEPILNAKSSKIREGALQILMTVSRIFPSTDLNIPKSIKCVIGVLHDRKRKVRQAALETLAALAQLSSNTTILETANEITKDWNDHEQILKVIRTRLSRKQLPLVNMNGNIRYSTPAGDSEIEWLSNGSNSASPKTRNDVVVSSSGDLMMMDQNVENMSERFVKIPSAMDRFAAATTTTANYNEGLLVKRKFNSAQEIRNRFVSSPNPNASYTRFVEEGESVVGMRRDTSATSVGKINYWRNNPRHQGVRTLGFDPTKEDPLARAPSTQIWAIDPTTFNVNEKVPSVNGSLRQIYLVKANDSKSASTNTSKSDLREDATNTSPAFGARSTRGRSFSPPTRGKVSDYDSYDEENERFISQSRRKRSYRSEAARKSFSSEHLSKKNIHNAELHRDQVMSSGSSSSGSSIRQSGRWQRDFRSNIPIPIYSDSKLRIKKTPYKPKGPMTIPYYPPVKSPSPQQTPEKFPMPDLISRQPFSSGSESSGYFTPPPETNNPDNEKETPHNSPSSSSLLHHSPQRFIQIKSPTKGFDDSDTIEDEDVEDAEENVIKISKDLEEDEAIDEIDNVVHDDDEDDDDEDDALSVKFSRKNSLDELKLIESESFTERTLSKNEMTNSLEFSKLKFSDDESNVIDDLSLARKNVNSAPALNELIHHTFDDTPIKPSLPGSCADSLDDIEIPDELLHNNALNNHSNNNNKKSPKKLITPKSVRRKSSRFAATSKAIDTCESRPFPKPREALHDIIAQLESNEWEMTMKGLQNLIRLIKHHKEYVENQMHTVCVLLGKHIKNLRSQVARQACYAATELFNVGTRKALEMEIDEIASPLLHRTADTNKFLRSDANATLDEMSLNLSVPKVVSVIVYRGCAHQNAIVRCASARLLCNIAQRLGAEKVFQLPRDTRDKILVSGANLLTEGSLETRKHAKMLFSQLAEHCQFQRALTEAVPPTLLRHIDKTLKILIK